MSTHLAEETEKSSNIDEEYYYSVAVEYAKILLARLEKEDGTRNDVSFARQACLMISGSNMSNVTSHSLFRQIGVVEGVLISQEIVSLYEITNFYSTALLRSIQVSGDKIVSE